MRLQQTRTHTQTQKEGEREREETRQWIRTRYPFFNGFLASLQGAHIITASNAENRIEVKRIKTMVRWMEWEEYEILAHARLNAQPKQMNTVYRRKTKQPLYLVSSILVSGILYL